MRQFEYFDSMGGSDGGRLKMVRQSATQPSWRKLFASGRVGGFCKQTATPALPRPAASGPGSSRLPAQGGGGAGRAAVRRRPLGATASPAVWSALKNESLIALRIAKVDGEGKEEKDPS